MPHSGRSQTANTQEEVGCICQLGGLQLQLADSEKGRDNDTWKRQRTYAHQRGIKRPAGKVCPCEFCCACLQPLLFRCYPKRMASTLAKMAVLQKKFP
ncbi:unnamed protein product [Cylicocyclus nassatus]|uniref:Uncharacterized protein n=1 Tax=Cylicocyclus nassatus TaxID=53992 RepID=A0AA36HHV1_CYLNA|nr:unnamed protein product [Cylicocyclus nassatus]